MAPKQLTDGASQACKALGPSVLTCGFRFRRTLFSFCFQGGHVAVLGGYVTFDLTRSEGDSGVFQRFDGDTGLLG